MRRRTPFLAALAVAGLLGPVLPARAGETRTLDLAGVLELVGARSIDVEIAREESRLASARARQADQRFFPWLAPGFGYRHHDGALADIQGLVTEIEKESYDASASLQAEVDLGDAIFASRAEKRRAAAAERRLDATSQDATLEAVSRYLDLLLSEVREEVLGQAEKVSSEYAAQLGRAVEAGLAARAEQMRVEVQASRNRLARQEAAEAAGVAEARLAEVLRLDPASRLDASRDDLAALTLVPPSLSVEALLAHALATRGEVLEARARVDAARETKRGALYGPLVPTVGVQVRAGSLGGGPAGARDDQDDFQDQNAMLRWRVGPGGLFDRARIDAADATLRRAELEAARTGDIVSREVVAASRRAASFASRIATAREALAAAETAFALARERREAGIDVVLENILAEQELTRTRGDYLAALVESTRTQYALIRALGGSVPP